MNVEIIKDAFGASFFADESVREQFLYYFASIKRKHESSEQTILCLYGVPGTGKKTMLQALCSALDWKLVTIKLGEVKNEEGQVVGSFRTDLNAVTARIIHALDGSKDDGSNDQNIAILLEDIDNINPPELHGATINFFEILEQMQQYAIQNNFQQHAVDLTKVPFFATARNLATIPAGLQDQLQFVYIPSYNEQDKLRITKRYILPQLEECHQLHGMFFFSHNALVRLIREYTREGGVRQVKKELNVICKKLVIKFSVRQDPGPVRIYANRLEHYLGPPRYPRYTEQDQNTIGVVSLLGSSDRGGCTMVLESLALQGQGNIFLTGNTDKLFEESARVAVNCLRVCAQGYRIEEDFIKKYDLHLHMQYGQVPKYGVSGGAAIIIALASALSNKPVRGNMGVTGEISLKGRILGVNNIRDKVLGACQAGLTHVLLPKENERDVHHLSREIGRGIAISLVDNVHDLLEQAIIWR